MAKLSPFIVYLTRFLWLIFAVSLLTNCRSYPTAQGQQYLDGEFSSPFNLSQPLLTLPVNVADYREQIELIKTVSPSLYAKNESVYQAIEQWLQQQFSTNQFNRVGLSSYQLAGQDDYGNVHLTGYYTPVFKARHQADEHYRYPLYTKPTYWNGELPNRQQIYAGAFAGQNLEIAYTRSLIDNFIMEVQGSGYIDFEDDSPPVFFGYHGKNGHPYRSIGRILVEQGDIARDKISMQAIKQWADKQSDQTVIDLLVQNHSAVFFKPQYNANVIGSAGVPLVAKASVASDKSLIPTGSVLMVEVPLLDQFGKLTGQRELRLMVALDIGGAIRGQHLDIYQGIGDEAGELAGFYNHYGRVWQIAPASNSYLSSNAIFNK